MGDGQKYEISEIDEPIKSENVLSFSDKYLRGGGKGKNQKGSMSLGLKNKSLDLNEFVIKKMKQIAEKVFVKLGLFGVVRIDFLYDEVHDKIYVCEVNAIPGSLAFYFFRKNRIVTNDLIYRLIEIAERNYYSSKVKTEFVVDILTEK